MEDALLEPLEEDEFVAEEVPSEIEEEGDDTDAALVADASPAVNDFEDLDLDEDALSAIEFVDNPEPRCPVVLILDRSASMLGDPMQEMNDGLRAFSESIKNDELAALRVEVAIVVFGPVAVLDVHSGENIEIEADAHQAFATAVDFQPPTIKVGGSTPMGEAVEVSLQLLSERKSIYKENGIDYFRPWMFLITDGFPTDGARWQSAAEQVREEESRKGVIFFGVGVDKADMQKLSRFSDQRPPAKLRGVEFEELFQWLSKSVTAVAQSKPGDQVPLPPVSWGEVDTST